jgi:ParB-like chromosome segregation protein Spo0J
MSERRFKSQVSEVLSESLPDAAAGGDLERWLAPTTESRIEQIPVEEIRDRTWRGEVDTADPTYRALKASIRASGVLQPLLLRPHPEGGYEVVSGARRLRAARDTVQSSVPAVVRELDDAQALVGGSWDAVLRAGLTPREGREMTARLVAAGMEEAQASALVATVPLREAAEDEAEAEASAAAVVAGDVEGAGGVALVEVAPVEAPAEIAAAGEAVVIAEPEDAVAVEAETVAEPEVEAAVEAEAPTEVDIEAAVEAEMVAEPEVAVEAPAEAETLAEPEVAVEPDAEIGVAEVEPPVEPDASSAIGEPAIAAETEAETVVAEPESAVEVEAPGEPEPAPAVEAEPEAAVEVEAPASPEPAPAVEAEPEAAVEVEAPAEPEPALAVEPEAEAAAAEVAADDEALISADAPAVGEPTEVDSGAVAVTADAAVIAEPAPHVIPIKLPDSAAAIPLEEADTDDGSLPVAAPAQAVTASEAQPAEAASGSRLVSEPIPSVPMETARRPSGGAGVAMPAVLRRGPLFYAVLGIGLAVGAIVFILVTVVEGVGSGTTPIIAAVIVAVLGFVAAMVSLAQPRQRR